MCVGVEGEGEEKRVEEFETKVADFHQPLQQAVQVATVHLGGIGEGVVRGSCE